MASASGGATNSCYDRPQASQNVQNKQSNGKSQRHGHDNSRQGATQAAATKASAASTSTIEAIIKNHLQFREG